MVAVVQNFLGQAGPWSLVVVFIVIVLESAAGLGLIFPGETLAVIAGAMASDAYFSPWTAFAVVALAAMTGDLTGYSVGQTKGKAARYSSDGLSRDANMKSTASASSTTSIIMVVRPCSSDASLRSDAPSFLSLRASPECVCAISRRSQFSAE